MNIVLALSQSVMLTKYKKEIDKLKKIIPKLENLNLNYGWSETISEKVESIPLEQTDG